MKIAIIRQRYNPYGGAERFVSRALAALSQSGNVSLHLIARSWEPVTGIGFHRCNPFYWGRLSRDAGFAYFACRSARALDADLIQSHERLVCCDIYRAGDGVHREWIIQKTRRQSWLKVWAMRLNPYHLYVQFAERRMFEGKRLRAVICNSHMVKNEITRYFNIDEQKIHVIYNGVDTKDFHPDPRRHGQSLRERWNIPGDATVFLFVGSGYERKGVQDAVEAIAGLAEKHYLLLVGFDKHENRYRTQAEKRGLSERILFLGAQKEVKPFYALADVFVLPTLYDPFPNAVLEAMACGLPVITSSKCGASELLADGNSGFICDVGDIFAIRSAMRTLSDKTIAAAMGKNARRIAEAHDWTIMRNALTSLYYRLLDSV